MADQTTDAGGRETETRTRRSENTSGTMQRSTEEVGRTAQGTASGTEAAASTARDLKRDAKEQVKEARAEVERQVRDTAEEVEERAREQADRWTSRAGDRVDGVARALRTTGEQLEEEGEHDLARWTREAADRVGRWGRYLEGEDPGSMMTDLEEVARSNPAIFLGGTFALGMAAGRFLRSSAPERGGADAGGADGSTGDGRTDERRWRSRDAARGTGATRATSRASEGGPLPSTEVTETSRTLPRQDTGSSGGQPLTGQGDSLPTSRTAPASAGEPHGSGGTVDTSGRPDNRPDRQGSMAQARAGTGETPTPSPTGRTSSTGSATGSSGAASLSASAASPIEQAARTPTSKSERDEREGGSGRTAKRGGKEER